MAEKLRCLAEADDVWQIPDDGAHFTPDSVKKRWQEIAMMAPIGPDDFWRLHLNPLTENIYGGEAISLGE